MTGILRYCGKYSFYSDRLMGFLFESSAFQIDNVAIPNSTHPHQTASLANYQGFPLILGGYDNNKLEMLNTMENPFRWVRYEGTDYPYSNR